MIRIFLVATLTLAFAFNANASFKSDAIVGRWINADNNLEVEIYKSGTEYRAKVVWFDDSDDKSKPMNSRCDEKNPNEALRSQRIIGLEVMHGLVFNDRAGEWQSGKIYDSSSGKEWDARVSLTSDGILKVRGYWHFTFLGQNISFKKVS